MSDNEQDREAANLSMAANAPSATFNIQPPEPFDFSKPNDWTRWIRRFERFRQASNLSASSEDNQVNTLIYCMGDEADDVLRGLKLSAADQHEYTKVRDGFESFFIVRKNIVFERARFNMRKQEANETVDVFVTALHALAEHCNYGTLHDKLLRDRIVSSQSFRKDCHYCPLCEYSEKQQLQSHYMSFSQTCKLSQHQTCQLFWSLWCDLYCLPQNTGQLVSLRLEFRGFVGRAIQFITARGEAGKTQSL